MSKSKNKLTIGGLCSGVGGIELGFRQAGFDISWANDMDKNAMITYESIIGQNHYIGGKAMELENIISNKKLSPQLTKVDVLAAGFPCQSFSLAGNKKGFDDERGNVFFKICDVLKFLKDNLEAPKVVFLENVKNFRTHDNGKTFKKVKDSLEDLNYSVYTKILNTSEISGIPQNRERTFMICFNGERIWKNYQLDNLKESFDLFSKAQDEKAKNDCPQTYRFHQLFNQINNVNKKGIWNFLDKSHEVEKRYFIDNRYKKLFRICKSQITKKDTLYQYRRGEMRENKNNNCPTLMANMGLGGHNVPIVLVNKKNSKYRKLTPLECFRFQGYKKITLPSSVADSQLYKQAGNSVTVPIIKKLALIIKKSIL